MIHVSRQHFNQLRYLIDQSIQGHHVLFDLESVRRALGDERAFESACGWINGVSSHSSGSSLPGSLARLLACPRARSQAESAETQALYAVEHHLERMIEQPTLDDKRAYLESLEPEVHLLVVRSYFTIIGNNLRESEGRVH